MSEWIAVKDQPIPVGVGVLVCYGFTYCKDTEIACIKLENDWMQGLGFGGYEWEWDFSLKDVTHWMPLPAPPGPIQT